MAPTSEASSQERQLPQQGAEEPTDLWEAGVGNSLLAGLPEACRGAHGIQLPQVRLKTGHCAGPRPTSMSLPGCKIGHISPHSLGFLWSACLCQGPPLSQLGPSQPQLRARTPAIKIGQEGMPPAFGVLCRKRTLCLTMAQTFTEELRSLS